MDHITIKHISSHEHGPYIGDVIRTHNDAKGKPQPFVTLLDAYRFAEQHLYAYNVLVGDVVQSVGAGHKIIADAKADGTYYPASPC